MGELCFESYINEFFSYDPDSGIVTRSDRKNSNGSKDHYGYIVLKIKGKQFKAHRVAWFLFYGEFPENVIDHVNRDKSDNRIKNLRDVKQACNVRNTFRKANKDTGIVGVYIDKTKGLKKNFATKYKRRTYRFATLEEAINFRKNNNLITHNKGDLK